MSFPRKATFAPSAFALLLLALLFVPLEAHADPIAITGGYYSVSTPFRVPSPSYRTRSFDLQGINFRAAGSEGDGPVPGVGQNCQFPCTAGSTFSINAGAHLFVQRPVSVLQIDGQTRFGWFGGGQTFQTDSVTIPLDAGTDITLTASFTMSGIVSFQEYDLQNTRFTGYTFDSEVFGSGIATISLFFSSLSHAYHISSVRYDFTAVPEPATMILLSTGLAGIAARRRRRRASK